MRMVQEIEIDPATLTPAPAIIAPHVETPVEFDATAMVADMLPEQLDALLEAIQQRRVDMAQAVA
jgi:hypothetical protein